MYVNMQGNTAIKVFDSDMKEKEIEKEKEKG
jgi:hypothetical protein